MSWVGVSVAAVGAGAQLYSANQANKREQQARDDAKKLAAEPIPQFAPTRDLDMYKSMVLNGIINPRGISAADKAASATNTTNAINTSIYNAKNQVGGNVSRFLAKAYTPTIVNNANEVILQDARMKDANYNANVGRYGGVANQYQNIADRNISNNFNRRMLTEQAIGNSVLQNQAYKQNTYNNLSSDLMGAGANMALYKYATRPPKSNSGNSLAKNIKIPTPDLAGIDPNYVDPSLYS